MRARDATLVLLLVLIAASLSPVLHIAYATSGSMEPTIPTNALYVVNTLDDDPEVGDILMYESQDKGRVTHRVIDVTQDNGYITKGDANDAPDQTSNENAVQRSEIIGVVPTVSGHPLAIPGSATMVTFVSRTPVTALLSLWLIFSAGFLFTTEEVGIMEIRRIVLPVLTVAFIASVVFLSSGIAYDVGFLATDGTHEGNSELVPANEESTQTLHLETNPPPLLRDRVVSATGGLRVVGTERHANRTNVSVHVPPLQDGTVERGGVIINYYPPVLPSRMLSVLHQIHPLVASIVTAGLCYLPVYLVYLVVVDPRKRLRPYVTRGNQP
jgi:signal peptidase